MGFAVPLTTDAAARLCFSTHQPVYQGGRALLRGRLGAWLCVLGAVVMLFNWIVINFVITGLHSYA